MEQNYRGGRDKPGHDASGEGYRLSLTGIDSDLRIPDSTRGCPVERVDDAVDHLLDQRQIFTLPGDANNRLGARRPHDQPAVAVKTLLAARNRRAHSRLLVGLAVPVADILGDLRQRIEAMTYHRNRLGDLPDHRQHLKGRNETVAGGGVVRQDDVAGRLAA